MGLLQIRKADNRQILRALEKFKARPIDDLRKIHLLWACGKNVDKLYDRALHPSKREYSIFFVESLHLIQKTDFLEVNPFLLFGNGNLSDFRVMNVLARWENKGYIDPPTIYELSNHRKDFAFSDGRHRTIAAYHLRQARIPVAVHISSLNKIQSIITLYKDFA